MRGAEPVEATGEVSLFPSLPPHFPLHTMLPTGVGIPPVAANDGSAPPPVRPSPAVRYQPANHPLQTANAATAAAPIPSPDVVTTLVDIKTSIDSLGNAVRGLNTNLETLIQEQANAKQAAAHRRKCVAACYGILVGIVLIVRGALSCAGGGKQSRKATSTTDIVCFTVPFIDAGSSTAILAGIDRLLVAGCALYRSVPSSRRRRMENSPLLTALVAVSTSPRTRPPSRCSGAIFVGEENEGTELCVKKRSGRAMGVTEESEIVRGEHPQACGAAVAGCAFAGSAWRTMKVLAASVPASCREWSLTNVDAQLSPLHLARLCSFTLLVGFLPPRHVRLVLPTRPLARPVRLHFPCSSSRPPVGGRTSGFNRLQRV